MYDDFLLYNIPITLPPHAIVNSKYILTASLQSHDINSREISINRSNGDGYLGLKQLFSSFSINQLTPLEGNSITMAKTYTFPYLKTTLNETMSWFEFELLNVKDDKNDELTFDFQLIVKLLDNEPTPIFLTLYNNNEQNDEKTGQKFDTILQKISFELNTGFVLTNTNSWFGPPISNQDAKQNIPFNTVTLNKIEPFFAQNGAQFAKNVQSTPPTPSKLSLYTSITLQNTITQLSSYIYYTIQLNELFFPRDLSTDDVHCVIITNPTNDQSLLVLNPQKLITKDETVTNQAASQNPSVIDNALPQNKTTTPTTTTPTNSTQSAQNTIPQTSTKSSQTMEFSQIIINKGHIHLVTPYIISELNSIMTFQCLLPANFYTTTTTSEFYITHQVNTIRDGPISTALTTLNTPSVFYNPTKQPKALKLYQLGIITTYKHLKSLEYDVIKDEGQALVPNSVNTSGFNKEMIEETQFKFDRQQSIVEVEKNNDQNDRLDAYALGELINEFVAYVNLLGLGETEDVNQKFSPKDLFFSHFPNSYTVLFPENSTNIIDPKNYTKVETDRISFNVGIGILEGGKEGIIDGLVTLLPILNEQSGHTTQYSLLQSGSFVSGDNNTPNSSQNGPQTTQNNQPYRTIMNTITSQTDLSAYYNKNSYCLDCTGDVSLGLLFGLKNNSQNYQFLPQHFCTKGITNSPCNTHQDCQAMFYCEPNSNRCVYGSYGIDLTLDFLGDENGSRKDDDKNDKKKEKNNEPTNSAKLRNSLYDQNFDEMVRNSGIIPRTPFSWSKINNFKLKASKCHNFIDFSFLILDFIFSPTFLCLFCALFFIFPFFILNFGDYLSLMSELFHITLSFFSNLLTTLLSQFLSLKNAILFIFSVFWTLFFHIFSNICPSFFPHTTPITHSVFSIYRYHTPDQAQGLVRTLVLWAPIFSSMGRRLTRNREELLAFSPG
jgi:hypothetical protein